MTKELLKNITIQLIESQNVPKFEQDFYTNWKGADDESYDDEEFSSDLFDIDLYLCGRKHSNPPEKPEDVVFLLKKYLDINSEQVEMVLRCFYEESPWLK